MTGLFPSSKGDKKYQKTKELFKIGYDRGKRDAAEKREAKKKSSKKNNDKNK